MITPTEILEQISRHYAEQLDATQDAAEDLNRKHAAFIHNVTKLLDVRLQLVSNVTTIKAPEDAEVNLFAVSVEDASGEALTFPPYIEQVWGLCETASIRGVSTALYSKVGYEDS